jgi:predicted phosphohydrolase
LYWLSGEPTSTPTEYWVYVRLIWQHDQVILDGLSGWSMPILTEYCVWVSMTAWPGNIRWAFRLTNDYTNWILAFSPANPTIAPGNIGWAVRLTIAYTNWILGISPANPTTWPGNIRWAVKLTNAYTESISGKNPANLIMLRGNIGWAARTKILKHHYLLLFGETSQSVNWISCG